MAFADQGLLKKLLATFKIEADEHIGVISSGLIEIEQTLSAERRAELVETVFREAHSLKGAARAVNLVNVEAICQSLENTFSKLRPRESPPSPELFDQLHRAVDTLSQFLVDARAQTAPVNEPPAPKSEERREVPAGATARAPSVVHGSPETIRVSKSKLDSLLRQAEEMISTKATGAHRLTEVRHVTAALNRAARSWGAMRPHAIAIQRLFEQGKEQAEHLDGQEHIRKLLMNFVELMDREEGTLRSIENQLASLAKHLENDHRVLGRRVDALLSNMKDASMIPSSAMLSIFPKLVRDLCRDFGKDAELVIAGGEIEADRRMLEEIKEPLIHLVRNCIDHGIESSNERGKSAKPLRGKITITVSTKGSDKIEVTVADDGRGIDSQKLQEAAVKLGFVSEDDLPRMDARDTLSLVFQSGVSTRLTITEVSGRGLGLAIVRDKIEKLGGAVSVVTQPGMGAVFRLILPLTIATFRGVLVRVGADFFVLPAMHVQRVLRASPEQIKSAENRELLQLNGRSVSCVRLRDVLGIPGECSTSGSSLKTPALLLTSAGEEIVFLVDEILGEQEVVIKSLGKQLLRVRNIAGATILGTGKVVPVLNVADLLHTAIGAPPVPQVYEPKQKPKSILVAEDSITGRTLLKNILESAGYNVKTAVDGAEAFVMLGNETFDLMISDVDMPRMTGLDLTAKVRADPKLTNLPVVLVTALESREDQQTGICVGANAYIVKSSFDQSNLLEVIRTLI